MNNLKGIRTLSFNLVKISCLALVIPALIGHGLYGTGTEIDTDETKFYFTDGGYSGIHGAGTITIESDEKSSTVDLTEETDSGGHLIGYFHFIDGDTFRIRLSSNASGEYFSSLALKGIAGELLLTNDFVADTTGEFFDATFTFHSSELDSGYTFYGHATTSDYYLAGGRDGSEQIYTSGILKVYINSSLVYEGTGTGWNSPVAFSANDTDNLKITVADVESTDDSSEVWLHRPDGSGYKLIHSVELQAGRDFNYVHKIVE